jgi:hypothetical protein
MILRLSGLAERSWKNVVAETRMLIINFPQSGSTYVGRTVKVWLLSIKRKPYSSACNVMMESRTKHRSTHAKPCGLRSMVLQSTCIYSNPSR